MALASNIRKLVIRFASFFYYKKRSKVIFYHDIHSEKKYTKMSTPIELFQTHINIIRESGYNIVSEITNPYGEVEICFDDAFLGLYDNIKMIKDQNIPIHLFVISSFLDKECYINKEQLKQLNNIPQVTISSHTHTHQVLSELSSTKVNHELKRSKKILSEILQRDVQVICYPEGKFSKLIIEIATAIGYSKQYSSLPGFYFNDYSSNVKKRSLVQFANAKEFKAILKGGDHILYNWYISKHLVK